MQKEVAAKSLRDCATTIDAASLVPCELAAQDACTTGMRSQKAKAIRDDLKITFSARVDHASQRNLDALETAMCRWPLIALRRTNHVATVDHRVADHSVWCIADMALQPRMGLLPSGWRGRDRAYSSHIAIAWLHLSQHRLRLHKFRARKSQPGDFRPTATHAQNTIEFFFFHGEEHD
jgi:hypothetical protein